MLCSRGWILNLSIQNSLPSVKLYPFCLFLKCKSFKNKEEPWIWIAIHSCLWNSWPEELNVFPKKNSLCLFQQEKLSPTTSNTQVRARQTQLRFSANTRTTTTSCIYRSKLIIVHAAVSKRWWYLCSASTLNTLVQVVACESGVVNSIRLNVYRCGT